MCRRSWLVLALALGACDADGDGLSDGEEEALGTDPSRADTDGDGLGDAAERDAGTDPQDPDSDDDRLEDGAELGAGTDPQDPDSDGDGYLDGWEVAEGKDPTDANSVIYRGGWPYNPDKDAYGAPEVAEGDDDDGDPLARFMLLDQFGDTLDIYDLAGQDQHLILDISAIWCGPCQAMAEWLSVEGDPYGHSTVWGHVKQAVELGELRWVTVLAEDARGGEVDGEELAEWYADFPEPQTPVLADADGVAELYYAGGYPTIYFIGPDLIIAEDPQASSDPDRFYRALYAAEDHFAARYAD